MSKIMTDSNKAKIFLHLFFTFFIFASISCVKDGKFKIERDRFGGDTWMHLDDIYVFVPYHYGVGDNSGLEVSLMSNGQFTSLMFRSSSENWQYLECNHLDLLADGMRVPMGETKHDGSVLSMGVYETISTDLNRSQIEQIRRASKIEGRLCGDEFVFNKKQTKNIREFLYKIRFD